MGIRFYCPKGHKLNVKAELAGKIGICPKCGERMLIPLISTRKSGESRHVPPEENMTGVPNSTPRPDTSSPLDNDAFPAPESNNPAGSGFPATATSEWESEQATQTSAIPLVDNSEPQPPLSEQPVWHDNNATTNEAVSPANSTVPESGSASSSLLNDPEVLWYVRTPDNQSYGPTTSPVIQSWIQEKRIGPHMLVWREGWSSWLEAGNVFPELEAVFTAPAQETYPTSPVVVGDDSPLVISSDLANEKRTARSRKAKRDLLLVISLIVVIIALIAGLIIVLVLQQRSVNTAGETAAVSLVIPQKVNYFQEFYRV